MITILIGLIIGIVLIASIITYSRIHSKNSSTTTNDKLPVKEMHLNKYSKTIFKKFMLLPPEHREAIGDLRSVLFALDIKHEIDSLAAFSGCAAYSHFYSHDFRLSPHENECTGIRRKYKVCPFRDYTDILDEINNLLKAIENQKHALKVAGVQHVLDDTGSIIEQLRAERSLIDDVTKHMIEIK